MPADRLTDVPVDQRDGARTDGEGSSVSSRDQPAPGRSTARDGIRLALAWTLTRATMLAIWLVALVGFHVPSARGDVAYYFRAISALGVRGPEQTMIEYPTPVVALTWLMRTVTGGNATAFLALFVAVMVACDAAYTWVLWRRAGQARRLAVGFWIAFVFLLGPTVFLRFDLIPAVLTASALLVATASRPRPVWAGGLVALGAALKLWPAATWPSTWGPTSRSRWRSTLGAFSVGAAVMLASVAWAGWARLTTPLTWQSDRGLQIESVFATAPMIARAVHLDRYQVEMSRFQAFEIAGPGTATWLSLASLAAMAGYLVVAVVAVVLWRRGADATASVIVMVLATVILVVANKTFSPQYMLWIGAPVAAGLARLGPRPRSDHDGATIRVVAGLVLALAAATALVYPIGYRPLIYGLPGVGLVTAVLAVRNLGMLVLLALVLRWAWRSVVKRRSA